MSVPLTGASAVLPDMGWKKKGHYQTGWSTSRIVAQAYFGVGQVLAYDWLERVAPSVDLYATWSPNEYVIVYDGNGATGNIASDDVVYTDTMQLPVEGFKFRRGTLAGWSLTPDAVEPEYLCGQTIDVAELVQKLGLEYTSNATICLYAVKGPAAPIHIRFISESYYKDENGNWIAEEDGGLWDDSIWKIDSSYTNILDSLFGA